MNQTLQVLKENYQRVLQRVTLAAEAAGRDPSEITIVGVTKYVDAETARLLFEAGCRHLGESRPQVLDQKATALGDTPITWHMIGHLQRNKVARTLQHASLIHSVDSVRLAEAVNRIAGEQSRVVDVLLEVNVSGESAKHGFAFSEIRELLPSILELPSVSARGLMCMAGLASDESETRNQFAQLRQLRDEMQHQLPDNHQFTELSMGMSSDFELAIAEGATMVRVGSVLFEGIGEY